MTGTRLLPPSIADTIRGGLLDFHGYRIESAGARGLFAHRGLMRTLGKVTQLDLTGNRIGAAGLEALARSPIAAQITSLKLTDCALGADAMALLDGFTALVHLQLDDNPLGPDGAARLAASERASRLEELDVSRCAIGADGLAALRASLRVYSLGAAFVDHGGDLGSADGASPRGMLALHGSRLGSAGVEALAAWTPKPVHLGLQYTGLHDEDLTRLGRAGVFERADHVDLRGNELSVAALLAAPFAAAALVQTSVDLDALRTLNAGRVRFRTDALEEGYVFACPYCREVHDLASPLCRHCGGDVTLDAGFEEGEDYLPRRVRKCPHCGERGVASAMRCGSCRSWLPRP